MVTGIQLAVSLSPGSSASDREREREKWAEMGKKIEQESENGVWLSVSETKEMRRTNGFLLWKDSGQGHRQTKVRDYLKRQKKNRKRQPGYVAAVYSHLCVLLSSASLSLLHLPTSGHF